MNKVATESAMGIADKGLSEELQVRSEQPREVECKCLDPHQLHWAALCTSEAAGQSGEPLGGGQEGGQWGTGCCINTEQSHVDCRLQWGNSGGRPRMAKDGKVASGGVSCLWSPARQTRFWVWGVEVGWEPLNNERGFRDSPRSPHDRAVLWIMGRARP